jgi:hypothetical protein
MNIEALKECEAWIREYRPDKARAALRPKRVRLIRRTSDFFTPPIGTVGTVEAEDGDGTFLVMWDTAPDAGNEPWYVNVTDVEVLS